MMNPSAGTLSTVHALPLPALRERARHVRRLLSEARRGLGRVGGIAQLDAALDATEKLLPGLMDRADRRCTTMAVVRRLRVDERLRLKRAVRDREALPRAVEQELADVAPTEILDAIERVALCDELAGEVMAVLRLLERGCRVA
jgi:hypothetical protein